MPNLLIMSTRPLSTGQVAEMFGVAPETVAKWADEGKLRSFKTPGGQRRFLYDDVEPFLLAPPTTEAAS